MIPQRQLSFKLERTNEKITPHAGLVLYAEFLKRSGIKELIQTHMPMPGSNRGYSAWEYILPAVLMLQGGGRHIEDIRQIRDDTGLRELIGLKRMPSLSTYGDWFRRMGNSEALKSLKHAITRAVRGFLKATAVKELTLWSDPTIIQADKADARMTY